MAICNYCNQDMLASQSCIKTSIKIDGKEYEPIKYGDENNCDADEHVCCDCGTPKGGYHHPGCDVEACPNCSYPLISCGCLDEDTED